MGKTFKSAAVEQLVDETDGRLVDELPQESHHRDRQYGRKEQGGAEERSEMRTEDAGLQDGGQPQREGDLEDDRYDGIDDVVEESRPEDRIAEQFGVIAEADEAPVG